MGTKPELFDVVDYLENKEDMQAYLNAVLEEDDEKIFLMALAAIARAKNISHLSKETWYEQGRYLQSIIRNRKSLI